MGTVTLLLVALMSSTPAQAQSETVLTFLRSLTPATTPKQLRHLLSQDVTAESSGMSSEDPEVFHTITVKDRGRPSAFWHLTLIYTKGQLIRAEIEAEGLGEEQQREQVSEALGQPGVQATSGSDKLPAASWKTPSGASVFFVTRSEAGTSEQGVIRKRVLIWKPGL